MDSRSFTLWLDFIERGFLQSGFKTLIDRGYISGATSNPTIFANAIRESDAYLEQLRDMDGLTPKEKYEGLAIRDIREAAKDIETSILIWGVIGYYSSIGGFGPLRIILIGLGRRA